MLIGRLGADPEMKTISNGNSVTRFNMATSESWMDRNGERQERTEWHRIVVWGKLGEICAKHLAKGRQAFVEGRLQTRSWEDQQGQKRYTTEIVAGNVQFLGAPGERGMNQSANNDGNPFEQNDFGPEPSFDSSEEIPF